MSVKVLIERRFKQEPFEPFPENLSEMINRLRMAAMLQKGYVSGESLVNVSDNLEVLVISTWDDIKDWEQWASSEKRNELEASLFPYLEKPVEIRIFKSGSEALKEALHKNLERRS